MGCRPERASQMTETRPSRVPIALNCLQLNSLLVAILADAQCVASAEVSINTVLWHGAACDKQRLTASAVSKSPYKPLKAVVVRGALTTSLKRGVNQMRSHDRLYFHLAVDFCLVVEELVHRPAKQYFDRQFLSLVFVRRSLPFELVWIQAPNGSNDFNSCSKRTETVSIDNVNLRAAAKLTGKFLEGWLEIVFAEENAGEL